MKSFHYFVYLKINFKSQLLLVFCSTLYLLHLESDINQTRSNKDEVPN